MQEKLLVVSPHITRYDLNSGDLRLFSILKMLSSLYEVIYLTNLKFEESDEKYISSLKSIGINILSCAENSLLDILRKDKFSAALFEFYFIAEHFLPRLKLLQPKCPTIIDTVDVHYYRAFSKYKTTGNLDDLRDAEEKKRCELAIYKKADIVITVTDDDAEILHNDCPTLVTRIIPNVHTLDLSNNIPDRNTLIFVGGFLHDPNIDAVLYFSNQVLPIIREVIPNIKFTIVGSNPPEEVKRLNNSNINVTGYVPSTTPYLHNNYISVAPLRYGAGMKGKIGEAMAHGRPVVTTSIGAQGMGLKDRVNIMIADSPEEFANSVIELMQNEQLYKTIQLNAVKHLENNYTEEQVAKGLHVIISEVKHLRVKRMSLSEKISFFRKYAKDFIDRHLQRS